MARRVAGGATEQLADEDHSWSELLAEGDVTFVSRDLADSLSTLPDGAHGLVVTTLPEWLVLERSGEDDQPDLADDETGV
jgi:hypothetical protein